MNSIELIKKYEGLKLESYKCPAGVWTIGYGHTKTAKPNQKISIDAANELLSQDIDEVDSGLKNSLGEVYSSLTQSQIGALTSFVFNLGIGSFNKSTLKRCVVSGNHAQASKEFSKWVFVGKTKLLGLVRRREDESILYSS